MDLAFTNMEMARDETEYMITLFIQQDYEALFLISFLLFSTSSTMEDCCLAASSRICSLCFSSASAIAVHTATAH
jgi:hypothetical protein